jgi:SAM-dependent methyltransferase
VQILQWIGGTDARRSPGMWQLGDYDAVARLVASAGEACVRDAHVGPGDEVLDVACGTGNAAIPAAHAGADVTGLDITPELLEIAAAREPVVRWVQGDAEALPFEDSSFDVVLSVFGCMFAAHHSVAARELLRVLRPGGRLLVSSWTPDGTAGQMFAAVDRYLPSDGDAPTLWGTEAHVRALLGSDVVCSRESVRFEWRSAEAAAAFYESTFGPLIVARRELGERWGALRADLVELFASHGDGDGCVYEAEYLTAQATKTGVPTSVLS